MYSSFHIVKKSMLVQNNADIHMEYCTSTSLYKNVQPTTSHNLNKFSLKPEIFFYTVSIRAIRNAIPVNIFLDVRGLTITNRMASKGGVVVLSCNSKNRSELRSEYENWITISNKILNCFSNFGSERCDDLSWVSDFDVKKIVRSD